jgi:hypothetical protein
VTQAAGAAEPRGARLILWWARIVCLSAFGPYLAAGARAEQAAIIASGAVVLMAGWPKIVRARPVPVPTVLLLFTALCAVIVIGTVWRPADLAFYGPQPGSHGLAYFLLPAALILVTWFWTLTVPAARLIIVIAQTTVVAMTANAVLSIAQLASGNAAVLSVLPRFWDSQAAPGSVASLAAENGRYTGIFNQPAEAGIAYGLALFCLIFLTQRGTRLRGGPALCAPVAGGALLITGGVLTVSKMFLFLALPLAAILVMRARRNRVRVVLAAALIAGAFWLLGHAGMLPAWPTGSAELHGLLSPSGPLVSTYTANRYGQGGSLGPVASDVLRSSLWYGFGAGGLDVPYDSMWIEVLAVSGLIGLVLLLLILGALAHRWVRLRGSLGRPEWLLAGASLALAAGGSLGLPSLTANRASTLLWLILGVLVCAQHPRQRPVPPARRSARLDEDRRVPHARRGPDRPPARELPGDVGPARLRPRRPAPG